MAVEVLTRQLGSCTLALGPDSPAIRVRPNSLVVWLWPLPKDGEDLPEGIPKLPRYWEIQRLIGAEELETMMKGMTFVPPDPQRTKLRVKEEALGAPRSRENDLKLVEDAVMSLRDDENGHWTRSGLPQIQIIREIVERVVEKETNSREWPTWITRDLLNSVTQRVRGDGDSKDAA